MKRTLALLVVLVLGAGPAYADDAATGDRAVALGHEGLDHYHARAFALAFERLEQAERLAHSPVFVLYMARSKRQLGELTLALALFRRCAEETLPAEAPAAWARAKQDAATEAAEVEQLLPQLTVTVPNAATLEVDGKPVALAASRATMTLDPGAHHVRVTHGDRRIDRTLTLRPAARESLDLAVEAAAAESAGTAPGSIVPGVTLLAVGGAALLAATGTGIAAWVVSDDIQSRCQGNSCLRSDADAGDTLSALATTSTVCFVAGGVVAATGLVLTLVRPGEGAPTAEARIGPGGVSLSTSF